MAHLGKTGQSSSRSTKSNNSTSRLYKKCAETQPLLSAAQQVKQVCRRFNHGKGGGSSAQGGVGSGNHLAHLGKTAQSSSRSTKSNNSTSRLYKKCAETQPLLSAAQQVKQVCRRFNHGKEGGSSAQGGAGSGNHLAHLGKTEQGEGDHSGKDGKSQPVTIGVVVQHTAQPDA